MALAIRTPRSLGQGAEQVTAIRRRACRQAAIPPIQVDQQPGRPWKVWASKLWRRNTSTIPDLLARRLELARRRPGLKARIAGLASSVDSPDGDAAAYPGRLLDLGQGRAARPQLRQVVEGHHAVPISTMVMSGFMAKEPDKIVGLL